MSYQVLEEWAALGLGAAILPRSKLHASGRRTYPLTDRKGKEISLDFEAVWGNSPQKPAHLQFFAEFLERYRNDS